MKRLILAILTITGFASVSALAGDSLPFPVTVGGQAAKDGSPFAKLTDPVAANAAIEVGAKADLVIINVHKARADGSPAEGSQPAIILLQGTTKGALDQTMDKQKLAPGNYFLSVVAGEKTASIHLTIK
ncbi:MAG: hypothetical protein QOE70_1823 [Chthoniobacter sp.]|jgi:hypothetical protein|nr:hypothetical protein [Chthoniobacter sp.]